MDKKEEAVDEMEGAEDVVVEDEEKLRRPRGGITTHPNKRRLRVRRFIDVVVSWIIMGSASV